MIMIGGRHLHCHRGHSMNAKQLRDYIIKPSLVLVGYNSKAAEKLLLGTACTESDCGNFVHQINGPALGIYQMEPTTHDDIWVNFLQYKGDLATSLLQNCNFSVVPDASELVSNLKYATIMARLHYLRVPESLPNDDDLTGIAGYYKKYYNTPLGKGSVDKFIKDYNRFNN